MTPQMDTDLPDGERDIKQRPNIEQFAIDYDIPQPLANRLVGMTETETQNNMAMLVDYLKSVLIKYRMGEYV